VFPLNLYARVRFFLCTFAHETAGAARTRLSLHPFGFEGVGPRPDAFALRERDAMFNRGRPRLLAL
jgi:hypothetical protein